jgi:hypothetical protein
VELHYGKDDFVTYDNLKRTLSRGESKVLAVEFAQARGLEYELSLDTAAQVESQTNFTRYFDKILSESVPIKGTLAEEYLKHQGIENINISSVQFHPAVWEKETQTHMPALVAKAVGQGAKELESKGIQVTYLDNNTGQKAVLDHPVRYSGSSDAIIMLQKPAQPDQRWYVAADIETGLALTKANPSIRVAALATQEKFDKNPLQGQGIKELIFCANQTTSTELIDKAVSTFTKKQFTVQVATPQQEQTFMETFNRQGAEAVCHQLEQAETVTVHQADVIENDYEIEL